MFKKVRTLETADKALLAVELLNAGVKARIAKQRIGYRVCFTGPMADVREVLNANGFLTASGDAFTDHSFNGSAEVFVRYAAL